MGGEVQKAGRAGTQHRRQRCGRLPGQCCDRVDPGGAQARHGRIPHAPQVLQPQRRDERGLLARRNDEQAVRLCRGGGELRDVAPGRAAHGDREAELGRDAGAQRCGRRRCRPVQPFGARKVDERFVDRDRLHVRAEPAQHLHHLLPSARRSAACADGRTRQPGTGGAPRRPASRIGCRTGALHTSRRRPHRGRAGPRPPRPDGREAPDRRAARRTRRTRRGRRGARCRARRRRQVRRSTGRPRGACVEPRADW